MSIEWQANVDDNSDDFVTFTNQLSRVCLSQVPPQTTSAPSIQAKLSLKKIIPNEENVPIKLFFYDNPYRQCDSQTKNRKIDNRSLYHHKMVENAIMIKVYSLKLLVFHQLSAFILFKGNAFNYLIVSIPSNIPWAT